MTPLSSSSKRDRSAHGAIRTSGGGHAGEDLTLCHAGRYAVRDRCRPNRFRLPARRFMRAKIFSCEGGRPAGGIFVCAIDRRRILQRRRPAAGNRRRQPRSARCSRHRLCLLRFPIVLPRNSNTLGREARQPRKHAFIAACTPLAARQGERPPRGASSIASATQRRRARSARRRSARVRPQ